jgi:hypothetical protein
MRPRYRTSGRNHIGIPQPLGVAEKVISELVLVAQAFLTGRVLLHATKAHSQEWLCYSVRDIL